MSGDDKRGQAFLEDQLAQIARQAARLQHASDACQSVLERQGLQSRVQTIALHRDLLKGILAECVGGSGIPLEGVIQHRLKDLEDQSRRPVPYWRRGHPVPSSYWELETRRGILLDLQNRYHIWRNHNSRVRGYGETDQPTRQAFPRASFSLSHSAFRESYPWYLSEEGGYQTVSSEEEARLEHLIRQVAATTGSEDSLDATNLGGGWVLLKGYCSNAVVCGQAMQQIARLPGLRGLLSHVESKRS